MDVALRIATDLDGAVKDVDALDKSLDNLKAGGQNAAQGLNAAATASGKNSRYLWKKCTSRFSIRPWCKSMWPTQSGHGRQP